MGSNYSRETPRDNVEGLPLIQRVNQRWRSQGGRNPKNSSSLVVAVCDCNGDLRLEHTVLLGLVGLFSFILAFLFFFSPFILSHPLISLKQNEVIGTGGTEIDKRHEKLPTGRRLAIFIGGGDRSFHTNIYLTMYKPQKSLSYALRVCHLSPVCAHIQ